MKKNILSLSAIALIVSASVFTGCKKDDVTAPVVALTGDATQTISLQGSYSELGATAEDEKDGKLDAVASGTVNKDLAGSYTITYTATDAAGNSGTATRTVIVKNDAQALAGTYTGAEKDGNGPYVYGTVGGHTTVMVEASTTVNNRVTIDRLGDFTGNTVYMMVTGTVITIPSQTIANVGTGSATCNVHSRKTDGAGETTSTGFSLIYNDAKVAPCTGTRTAVVATFVKQ
jgi:hypothetical protein